MHITEAVKKRIVPWSVDNLIREDFHVAVFKDAFPVTEGHLLFVPAYNDSDSLIRDCFDDALREGRQMVEKGLCEAFNIGINLGQAAGQTVEWPHVHLIPRRSGDVENPVGGVRNVIPGKGDYLAK